MAKLLIMQSSVTKIWTSRNQKMSMLWLLAAVMLLGVPAHSKLKQAACPAAMLEVGLQPTEVNLKDFKVKKRRLPDGTEKIELEHKGEENVFLRFEVIDDRLKFVVQTKGKADQDATPPAKYRGQDLYDFMMSYLNDKDIPVHEISGRWYTGEELGTNAQQFFLNLEKGMSPENAALETWSGKQARRYGFDHAKILSVTGNRSMGQVTVLFQKDRR